jgi:PKD repeat protein
VAFSPDGSFFAIDATGGGNPGTLCDATARFNTNLNTPNAQPFWIAQTGGDTTWGLTITNTAIYMGGHFRWENNPLGVDKAQPGAVPRAGMAALDVNTGRPFAWNPGHVPLGVSAFAFLATTDGVWMGSDFDYIGNHKYKRPKLAFFPYTGGYTAASNATATLPATAYLAGNTKSTAPNNVLYRVDAGGPQIASLDSGPDWSADITDPSPYRNSGGSSFNSYGPGASTSSTVPSSTPNAIFNSERIMTNDNPGLKWTFAATKGLKLQVRLYFANRCTCTSRSGQRVFTVRIDNQIVLSNYDVVRDVGNNKGTMKSFSITSDGIVNIDFSRLIGQPLINGIEIIRTDLPAPGPLPNTLSKIAFSGTTAASSVVDNQGIDFGNWRGAFMVGSKVYYGYSDSFWYSRTFDGTTFGPAVKVDPYHDPYWSSIETGDGQTFVGASPSIYGQISNITGMAYANGRVFYTLSSDPHLYARWFLPDSAIVDETAQTMTSSVDFSSAAGMFIVNGTLYYGSTDGVLRSVSIGSDGTVSGSPVSVSGPAIDGVNWFNRAMFLYAKQNIPPVAAFTSTCNGTSCSFDGSASVDVDGSITAYNWDFGDGATASGVTTTSHDYGTSGTFTVTLSVTDNQGVETSVSHDVGVSTTPPVTFVAASDAGGGNVTKKTVVVPTAATAGNVAVLFFAQTSTATWSTPSGWTALGSFTQGTLTTKAFEKVLGVGDPGSAVLFTTSGGATHASAQIVVYNNVDTSQPIENLAMSGDNQSTLHTSPVATAGTADYGVTFYAGRSSATRTWTAPAALTVRDATADSGSLTVQALAADSNSAIPAGDYGGYTASTDAATGYASSWTIVLRHAPPPNIPPVAAVNGSCTGMTCSFDASDSFDPDNGTLTYAWDFGDGQSGNGISPTHTYAAMGTYNVTVTVTDNRGGNDDASTSVTVPDVQFVDAADAPGGSAKGKQVSLPDDATTGDTAVLLLTETSTATWTFDPSSVSGWTQIDTFTTGTLTTTAWVKTLTDNDIQGTIKVTTSTSTHASLDVVIYRGIDAAHPVAAFAHTGDAGGTSHTTPTIAAPAGSFVVSFWGDRASAPRTWTAPAGLPTRAASADSGSLTTQALIADSGDIVPAGNVGGATATTDGTTQATAMWTIALNGV